MLDTLKKGGGGEVREQAVGFHQGRVVLSDLTNVIGKVTDLVGRVVRSMPNTPVKVRNGSVAVHQGQNKSDTSSGAGGSQNLFVVQ